jgi:hypothetical protein
VRNDKTEITKKENLPQKKEFHPKIAVSSPTGGGQPQLFGHVKWVLFVCIVFETTAKIKYCFWSSKTKNHSLSGCSFSSWGATAPLLFLVNHCFSLSILVAPNKRLQKNPRQSNCRNPLLQYNYGIKKPITKSNGP